MKRLAAIVFFLTVGSPVLAMRSGSGGSGSGSGDIEGITAGTNLNGGGASGSVTVNVDDDISLSTISLTRRIEVPAHDGYGAGAYNLFPQYSFVGLENWGFYKHPSFDRYAFTYGDGANAMYNLDRTFFGPGLNTTMDLGESSNYWKTLYTQYGVFSQNVTVGTTLTISGLGLNDCVGSNSDGMLITGTCTGGGGGGSSIAMTTGTSGGFTGNPASTPTIIMVINQDSFIGQKTGGSTWYFQINGSSWTSREIADAIISTMSQNYFRLASSNVVTGQTRLSSTTITGPLTISTPTVSINGVRYPFPSSTGLSATSTGTFAIKGNSTDVYVAPLFTEYYEYIEYAAPDHIPTTSSVTFETSAATSPAYGKANFQHAVSSQFNDAIFYGDMLRTYDSSIDLRLENFSIMVGSTADTASSRWIVDVSSFANGAALSTAQWINAAIVDIPADASGAAFDVQGSTTIHTLTGWKSALVAGAPYAIRVARDGDATNDASTQKAYLRRFKIRFGVTNP